MKTTFEVRTKRNRVVSIFDRLESAVADKAASEKRIGIPLLLFKVVQTEELIDGTV